MHHCSEEDLVLHHYGDHADRRSIAEHLAACGPCREEFSRLQRVLVAIDEDALPVPERGETYGREVWYRLRPHLPDRREGWVQRLLPQWHGWRQWAMAGGFAVLLLAAFVAGRYSPRETPAPASDPAVAAVEPGERVRERVLLIAVGDHLDRSQMVLAELVNSTAGPGRVPARAAVDISHEQQWAQDLVASNRLYRQTAAQTGDTGVETVLDELEPILLEIARSPSSISAVQLEELQQRIEAQGLLFKIRIVGSNVRERQRASVPATPVS